MKKHLEAVAHVGLLVAAAAMALFTWTSDAPTSAERVVAFNPGSGGVKGLEWEDETTRTSLRVAGTGAERTALITAGRRAPAESPTSQPGPTKAPPAADAGAPADAAVQGGQDAGETQRGSSGEVAKGGPQAADPFIERTFPGNDRALELLDAFEPLRALRRFDTLGPEAAAQMGMDAPSGRLKIILASSEVSFEVGAAAFGSQNVYARREGQAEIYLLPSRIVAPLRSASAQLMERKLFTQTRDGITSARVTQEASGKSLDLLQQGRLDKTNAFWARAQRPETRDTTIDALMEKVFQLRVRQYSAVGLGPTSKDLDIILQVRMAPINSEPISLSIARVQPETSGGGAKWFARSSLTRSWASISPTLGADLNETLAEILQ